MPVHLSEFVVTAFLLAVLPGAGQAVVLRQTLAGGRRAGAASIAGTCTGLMLWSTAAAAGLSAVLLATPVAYTAVRLAGALVLVSLGVSSLLALRRPAEDHVASVSRGAYLSGLATNLGNPKAGVFAISLLPQFVEPAGHVFASSVALGAVWAGSTAAWYVLFVLVVSRGRALITRPAVARCLQATTGVVLLLLGGAVALGW